MTITRHPATHALFALAIVLVVGACASAGQEIAGEQVIETGTPDQFLTCQRTDVPPPDRRVIGRAGGQLRSGNSTLTIPPLALQDEQEFVLMHEQGDRVGVRIEAGQPVRFAGSLSAVLFVDTSHCSNEELGQPGMWSVWRMANERGGESQRLRTTMTSRGALTHINSTSLFMIAD